MSQNTARIWGTLDPFYESGQVLGRKVANTRFMDFLLKADPYDEYHFFLPDEAGRNNLRQNLDTLFPSMLNAGRIKLLDRRELPVRLAETDYYCFHQSDCITYQTAISRLRNAHSKNIFPVTGPTHSLSYADFGMAFLRHLWPGACARDCIVATSKPGLQVVRNIFDSLQNSYSLPDHFNEPSLRIVPLGVDTNAFVSKKQDPDGPVRLLVFGRIAHYSKMDLLPLFRALQSLFADGLPKEKVSLTLAGWVEEQDQYAGTLKDLARNIGLDLTVVERPHETVKQQLFRDSDIFVSIADNPQETFGITVIEAGAAGLPAVVSDYDGYRDLILHDETGLRIPTMGPMTTHELDMQAPILADSQYHLHLAQETAVDVPALAAALKRLILNPELRRDMGQRAHQRVSTLFSWPSVIKRYVELWEELWQVPVDATSLRGVPHPVHMPYGEVFAHYTTQRIGPGVMLEIGRTGHAVYRKQDHPLLYAGMERLVDMEIVRKILVLARKPIDSEALLSKLSQTGSEMSRERAEYHVLWALKHDLLAQSAQ